ncbi:hypothetical protein P175DRAFT_0529945 [Aspergillus ochraceoroseus IBT 24754]|uniref:Uncharacterized protein n=1 Tax=Aspergillus ochraceoroseus IBT 24754 TaxID=1392256 RepID=A0A2T5M2T4_9EURO|nr:uncharacterized protein P175DRAFT_0529945 [Aspergillus ochraceoroseus IBT 24754]PTU22860.1 hypothetical protein P175DRAFT_0529945 [Aspergillus ochraceoroseus IBT 24754]
MAPKPIKSKSSSRPHSISRTPSPAALLVSVSSTPLSDPEPDRKVYIPLCFYYVCRGTPHHTTPHPLLNQPARKHPTIPNSNPVPSLNPNEYRIVSYRIVSPASCASERHASYPRDLPPALHPCTAASVAQQAGTRQSNTRNPFLAPSQKQLGLNGSDYGIVQCTIQ